MKYLLSKGKGRTQVSLQANPLGPDLVVCIFNKNGHVGAVAIGEYDSTHKRASVSIITRLGHKDDLIAQKAAYEISKATQKAVCTVVGIHLTKITREEIDQFMVNANQLVEELLDVLRH